MLHCCHGDLPLHTCIIADTTIAELIKNTTDRDEFLDVLHAEQCG